MSKFFSSGHRFSTHLVAGFVILIVISTLSAGAPAYWLTRTQLEQQAWSNLEDGQRATRSLIQAEQSQLTNLATLLAERPTLHRIIQEQTWAELRPFLQSFQAQSKLDILFLCHVDGPASNENNEDAACPDTDSAIDSGRFMLFKTQPALLVSHSIRQIGSNKQLGMAVSGIWLDADFLQQMAINTGVQQSILTKDGVYLSSSFSGAATDPSTPSAMRAIVSAGAPTKRFLTIGRQNFYAIFSPLNTNDDPAPFLLELALPVNELMAAEKRALAVLIISTGVIVLLGMLLADWYIRRLTKPLGLLTEVAERIGNGDFVAPIPAFATPAEVATLSTAFIKSQASMLRTLEERSQARDWLNNLVQSIVEGVITFDAQGHVTFLSQGAENLTGWHSDEALGQPINLLFPPPDEQTKSFLDRIPPPGSQRQIEVLNRHGKAQILAVTGARLTPPTADTMQVALVLRDVTHEEALRHLRSYFLANISHEFKTPLSTLNASLELLLDGADELSVAEMREVLKPAHMSLLGLQNLIDNLLQSSSIEAGHFVIRKRPTHLQQVISNALLLVQPLLDRRQQLFCPGDSLDLWEIQADPARLTQVLVNLLVNASKYSPIGEPIELDIKASDDKLRISVADRGPGIPTGERLNLFRRFVRLDAQMEEEYGTGLGLYVVKTTIEAHGGQVGIDDRPGGGSIFWFELPMA
jgi:PAS domain S-box-containing protein